MVEVVKTVYHNGAFVPEIPINLSEETQVEIVIEKKAKSEKADDLNISDKERSRRLKELVERMQKNPIPLNAPRLSREDLY